MKHLKTAALLGLACALAGCGAPASAPPLTGGGSSFVNPLLTKWSGLYLKAKNVRVDYSSTGSANGIQQMLDKKNDFGCTDAPMDDALLERAGGPAAVLHVPIVMGGVVPVYNLEEVKEPLRFTGPVLAEIYLGKITRWNDPKLQEINPGVALPAKDIAVVHRSDGSGTTHIWTDYLCKVSPEWASGPGRGLDLKWPTGIGAQKSDGVAGQVARTPGALGYVELLYALNKKDITYGYVRNRAGEFVRASLESVTAAAQAALTDIPDDLRYSITDAPGKDAYPVSGTVWVVVYARQAPEKGPALAEFLRWVTHEGQEQAKDLHYSRLPPGLVERVEKKLEQIKW